MYNIPQQHELIERKTSSHNTDKNQCMGYLCIPNTDKPPCKSFSLIIFNCCIPYAIYDAEQHFCYCDCKHALRLFWQCFRMQHMMELLESGKTVDTAEIVKNLKYSKSVLDTVYNEEKKWVVLSLIWLRWLISSMIIYDITCMLFS